MYWKMFTNTSEPTKLVVCLTNSPLIFANLFAVCFSR